MLGVAVLILGGLAVAAPLVHRAARGMSGYVLAAVVGGVAAYFISLTETVTAGESVRAVYSWAPRLGVDLSFHLDGLSLLFALLVTVVGFFIVLYASSYLEGNPLLGRFYAYLIGFMTAMLGLVLADNVITLFVFWELTSVTSYLLIGFEHKREEARKAALQALIVTSVGGLAMLAGFILLGTAAGTYELSEMLAGKVSLGEHPLYGAILVLVLAGAFTKSAQFPFYFWLPGAMEAPTPVSAYLHSSTMVKAGVYLLARLQPVLGGTDAWMWALGVAGGLTMVLGAYLACRESYFKRVLAYSTVSSLGIMVALIGFGKPAASAVAAYILAHAAFKGALFMVAGSVDHATHTKDTEKLGGLWRAMPLTAAAAVLAALSMAGIPGMLGFAAKEKYLQASLDAPVARMFMIAAATATGVLTVAIALIVAWRPFFARGAGHGGRGAGEGEEGHDHTSGAHESPWRLWIGPLVLALAGLLGGLVPALFAVPLVQAAGDAMTRDAKEIDLSLAYLLHPGTALALSGAALAVGPAIYATRLWWRHGLAGVNRTADAIGPQRTYLGVFEGVLGLARLSSRVLQNGYLPNYVRVCAAVAVVLAGGALVTAAPPALAIKAVTDILPLEGALLVMIGIAALAATLVTSRLAAIAALGVVGYGVALVFVLFGALDVAMTQFAVETLNVIILLLVVYRLPHFRRLSATRTRVADAVVCTVFGAMMTWFTLQAVVVQEAEPISRYFAENSVPAAHGRNIVNVILVDFRALDTMGEITVLSLAAIGVFTLLRLRAARVPGTAPGAGEAEGGGAEGERT